MIDYRVYLVTDEPSRYKRNWLETIEAALDGGVTCVQYRDTESTPCEQFARARRLRDLLAVRHIPLIVNNDPELAATVQAKGVHVGQGDLPPEDVRRIVGPTCEIGLSITHLSQLASLAKMTKGLVNCLGIGPVYDARKTKPDAAHEMGLSGLREIVAHSPEFRNVAIGGITIDHAAEVLAAGAQGLAIVSALSQAEDPCAAAQAFRRCFK